MLPGSQKEPEFKSLYMHAPVFIAFCKRDGSVNSGRMAFAAYHSPAYEEFVDIIKDLIDSCEHPAVKASLMEKLSGKIRRLTARLSQSG